MSDRNGRDDGPNSYPDEHDGARLLGTSAEGSVAYYHPDDNLLLETDLGPDEFSDTPTWSRERPLASEESLGDLIGNLQRTLGLSQLTDYARSHLPGVSESDDEPDDTN